MTPILWFLIPIGLFTGIYGTMVGVGGGFVVVPVMLALYPDKDPELITSISLFVVFLNSLSGSWAYARMGRIDYKTGTLFAVATIPGAIIGALTTNIIPRDAFEVAFGLLLIGLAFLLFQWPSGRKSQRGEQAEDGEDEHTVPSYNLPLGIGISFVVGFLASLLGIGGGVFHVPMMIYVLNFPIHVATATSHFILAVSSFSGATTHLITGTLMEGAPQAILLSIGVVIGAQLGAKISTKVQGAWLIRGLAIALGIAGIRLASSIFF